MIPKRRTRPRMMAPKEDAPVRSNGHLQWVRGFACVCSEIDPTGCEGKIQACHVRVGTDGGTSMKPGDCWTFPACAGHHDLQHRIGERTFEQRFKLKLKDIAARMWRVSPHRIAWERKQQDRTPTPTPDGSTGAAEDVSPSDARRMSASPTTTAPQPEEKV